MLRNVTGIGLSDVRFIRKLRWTFAGMDNTHACTMKESFVRISNKPAIHSMPEMSIPSNPIPDEMEITYYDLAGETFPDAAKTTTGILRLYGGIGDLIESWTLEGCEPTEVRREHTWEDYIDSVWRIKYKVALYESAPMFQFGVVRHDPHSQSV